MGVSIPYSFGCLGAIPAEVNVRMGRPKPEVWHRMQPFEKQLRESGGAHGPKPEVWHRMQPFEKQLRGDKVQIIKLPSSAPSLPPSPSPSNPSSHPPLCDPFLSPHSPRRPKPEVWHRMQPFEKQLRGDKVVSIGMHVRQFGQGPARPNATVSPEELQRGMNDSVRPAFQCAEVSGRLGKAPLLSPSSSPPPQFPSPTPCDPTPRMCRTGGTHQLSL
ncbi:unnamed protein product [Closterium sp. Naga37s-1]|nr:unnamed protein product [Closterium sp. Naga37s-1]